MIRRLKKYTKRVTREESGFTLVEQIVTLTIVAMVLTAAMAALATGGLGLNIATSRNEAMSLAQAQMECIKDHSFVPNAGDADYVGLGADKCHLGDTHPGPADLHTHIEKPSGYDLGTGVFAYGSGNNVQKIEVTVYRGQNNVPVLSLEGLKVERP